MIPKRPCILLRHFADRLAPPRAVEGHYRSCVRWGGRGLVVIFQCFLRFAFHLFGGAHVVERENILGIGLERFLQQQVRFRGTALRKQPHGLDIGMIDLKRLVGERQRIFHGTPFNPLRTGAIDHGLAGLFRRERVKALRPIDLPLQFRNVAEVVQGKSVVRIEKIGFVEKLLGLRVVVLANGLHSLAVQALDGSEMATLGDRNFQVSRLGGLQSATCHCEPNQPYEEQALNSHGVRSLP